MMPNSAPTSAPSTQPGGPAGLACSGSKASAASSGMTPAAVDLTVPNGLQIQTIAQIGSARELTALPNGDLIVGTGGANVYIVPHAENTGAAGQPQVFATISHETPPPNEPSGGNNAEGVAFSASTCTLYVATEYHVWSTPYKDGDLSAENLHPIATVRTGPTANPGDGDYHSSTSVAVSGNALYASMGSSCNGCTGETDPQRAAIWRMNLDGSAMALYAKHVRNGIALAVDPVTGHLWAGDAGQDSLPTYHPYEWVDDVTASDSAAKGVADYGWPYCEENHHLYNTGAGAPANCNATVQPQIEFPAYITHIGAAFYPSNQSGTYAFPSQYRGALIVTSHGSWHTPGGCAIAPAVDYVPMNADTPRVSVDWSDPTKQYDHLVTGFQPSCPSTRIGRATGVAVGPQGSVFIGDDQAGTIYRIRPAVP
jgi:glucose/arabinose dehydrogenase